MMQKGLMTSRVTETQAEGIDERVSPDCQTAGPCCMDKADQTVVWIRLRSQGSEEEAQTDAVAVKTVVKASELVQPMTTVDLST